MKNKGIYLSIILIIFLGCFSYAQEIEASGQVIKGSALFTDPQILSIKLSYSNKELKRNAKGKNYVSSDIFYQLANGSWDSLNVKIRGRGNSRLENCHLVPVKVKIKKSNASGTLFEGHKKLKLVLPCLRQKDKNDNIIKEYLAYKLYELISPYHFKTRLVSIDFTEITGKKAKKHKLVGFLIEDIENTATRHNGQVIERSLHPLAMDNICSLQNDFFQYMIGNTDFSVANQHNEKLLFINKKIFPVPYDFDMSGLVDASYSSVSQVNGKTLNIDEVTERLFRGFTRDELYYQKVRNEFLEKRVEMIETIDRLELLFDDPKEFSIAKNYIESFFEIMIDDKKFDKYILKTARAK